MISKNFKREEFECGCGCGKNTVDAELLTVLERMRTYFNAPIVINSGNRCERFNKKIGGRPNSFHLYSKAADIKVKGVSARDVQVYLRNKYKGRYGIGSYDSFTHIDVRRKKARW